MSNGLVARTTFATQLAANVQYASTQQRALALAQLRYDNGIDNYLSVLTAQTCYYDAQLTVVTIELQRLTNLVDL